MSFVDSIAQLKDILATDPVKPGDLNGWLEVTDDETIVLAIRYLLKEQDRKTRYACADAINAIGANDPLIGVSTGIVLDAFKQTAHAACINAQAI